MTAEEYFVWQETQLERYDFYNGEVFAMSGGTDAHNTVTLNAAVALKNHLKVTPCRVFMSDVQLQLSSASHYAYPDVFVTCDPDDLRTGRLVLIGTAVMTIITWVCALVFRG